MKIYENIFCILYLTRHVIVFRRIHRREIEFLVAVIFQSLYCEWSDADTPEKARTTTFVDFSLIPHAYCDGFH